MSSWPRARFPDRSYCIYFQRNLLIEAVSPVVLTYSPEGLLTFGILSHTYCYKVTNWSHNLLIAHTVFDSGSLAGILQCLKPVSLFCRGRDEGSPYSLRTADVFPVVASLPPLLT